MELFRRLGCADAVRDAGLPADFNTDVVYMTRLNGVEITRYERSTPAEVRAGAPARCRRQLADARAAALPLADLPRTGTARARGRTVGRRPARRMAARLLRPGRRRRHVADRGCRHRRAAHRAQPLPRRLRRRRQHRAQGHRLAARGHARAQQHVLDVLPVSARVGELAKSTPGMDAALRRRRHPRRHRRRRRMAPPPRRPRRRGPATLGPGAGDVRRHRRAVRLRGHRPVALDAARDGRHQVAGAATCSSPATPPTSGCRWAASA